MGYFVFKIRGMGTELEKKGIKLDKKLWSSFCLIDNEKEIFDIHYEVIFFNF
jgi:S-methylmethionine-dependent homocysteine/selenocysteine methylase